MWQQIVLALLPFICGVVAGVVVAYPRGFRTGHQRARQLLPKMVNEAVHEILGVRRGQDGNRN